MTVDDNYVTVMLQNNKLSNHCFLFLVFFVCLFFAPAAVVFTFFPLLYVAVFCFTGTISMPFTVFNFLDRFRTCKWASSISNFLNCVSNCEMRFRLVDRKTFLNAYFEILTYHNSFRFLKRLGHTLAWLLFLSVCVTGPLDL